ncbi:hypothetical protein M8J77_025485 [Diaphorina citri]|nr:hypothetical protein M8J77_025485 [Diaphorina citri]
MSIIGRAEIHQYEDDIGGGFCLGSENESPPRGPSHLLTPCTDKEKRIRREIANSNERRRMQSINAGFQSLRTLLPHHEGEKLSKFDGIVGLTFLSAKDLCGSNEWGSKLCLYPVM